MFELTWALVKVPMAVLLTDTLMWFKWSITDGSIDSYEWKILVDRLLMFGSAGVLLVFAGMSWESAASIAGLSVFADAWLKTLVKPKLVEPTSGLTKI